MTSSKATIVRQYGPFPGAEKVNGVTFDGELVWFAAGDSLRAFDPDSGALVRTLDVAGHAGTAFDGRHLFQISGDQILKIEPETGQVVATIPAPGQGRDSGLAWAEGSLWVGEYRSRKIHQVNPETGELLRTIHSDRFVTGVAWLDGELWHATLEHDQSELRRLNPDTGDVREILVMPPGAVVSGLESNGRDLFYCGGGPSGTVRAVRRPERSRRKKSS